MEKILSKEKPDYLIDNYRLKYKMRKNDTKYVSIKEYKLIHEIKVDSASMLKRIRTAPQGRAHRIRKRSNHVTIVLNTKDNK